MKWCVVIPTFNNEATLLQVLQDVLAVTPDVIVVNDGSTDQTEQVLGSVEKIVRISFPLNRGKGHALKAGFAKALEMGFTHAVTLDSDGQHFASDIAGMIEMASEFPDSIVIGRRTLPVSRVKKSSRFANRFSNFWFRLISGTNLSDTQSGFRCYPILRLNGIHFYGSRYEFELEVLVRSAWKGIPLREIPIRVHYPEKHLRISHFRPFHDFMRISLLNTLFVMIALFFVKPLQLVRFFRSGRLRQFIHEQIMQTRDSVEKTTLSVMLGVFMGIVPIWGYQLITAIALAYIFRLNKMVVIVAANISIFPLNLLIIYACYVVGGWILSVENTLSFSMQLTLDAVMSNLVQFLLGSFVFAAAMAILFGGITFITLQLFRRHNSKIP